MSNRSDTWSTKLYLFQKLFYFTNLRHVLFFAYFAAFWKNTIIIVANLYPKNGPDYYNCCLLLIFHSFLGTKNRM